MTFHQDNGADDDDDDDNILEYCFLDSIDFNCGASTSYKFCGGVHLLLGLTFLWMRVPAVVGRYCCCYQLLVVLFLVSLLPMVLLLP